MFQDTCTVTGSDLKTQCKKHILSSRPTLCLPFPSCLSVLGRRPAWVILEAFVAFYASVAFFPLKSSGGSRRQQGVELIPNIHVFPRLALIAFLCSTAVSLLVSGGNGRLWQCVVIISHFSNCCLCLFSIFAKFFLNYSIVRVSSHSFWVTDQDTG